MSKRTRLGVALIGLICAAALHGQYEWIEPGKVISLAFVWAFTVIAFAAVDE